MQKIRSSLFSLLALLLLGVLSTSAVYSSDDLHFISEQNAPYNFTQKDIPQGLAIDILEEVLKRMNYPFKKNDILFFPWSRAYREAQLKEQKSIIFTISRTPEREDLFQWAGPFATDRSVIFTLLPLKETKKLSDLFQMKIAVIRDDISKYRLISQGFPVENIVEVTSKDQLFSMLKKKRVDAFCHGELPSYYALKQNNVISKSDLKVIYVNQQGSLYFGFNKTVEKSFVTRFQKTLSDVLKDQQLIKSVHSRYF